MDDNQLLHRYCTNQDHAAFAELVERHSAWVYSAARRQLMDEHVAHDVTQAVFLLLSKKAPALTEHRNLAAWLFTATRYCAKEAQRQRIRQRKRDQEAAAMRNEAVEPQADWDQISPVLEDAVARMPQKDRQAVLLRFYQQLPLADIGTQMGISEDAARKRITRALEKLRNILSRKGITAGAVALGAVLADKTTQAAPTGLSAGITSTVQTGGATTAHGIASGAAKLLALAKAKIMASIAAGILILTGGTIFSMLPASTRPIPNPPAPPPAAPVVAAVDPSPIAPPRVEFVARGVVLDPDGKPIANARVWLPKSTILPSRTTMRETHTDAEGRYELAGIEMPQLGVNNGSVIIDAPGYSLAWQSISRGQLFRDDLPVVFRLEKPQTLEGRVVNEAGQPVADAEVSAIVQTFQPRMTGSLGMKDNTFYGAKTDQNGYFVLGRLPSKARAHLTVDAAGYARFESMEGYRNIGYPYSAGTQDTRITLHPGGQCVVQLKTGPDTAIGATSLVASREGTRSISAPIDGQGLAHFKSLAPGRYQIQAMTREWAPLRDVEIKPGNTLHLTMERLAVSPTKKHIAGQLLDTKTRKPLAQTARLTAVGHAATAGDEFQTGRDGSFAFDLVPGEYELATRAWFEGRFRVEYLKFQVPESGEVAPMTWTITPHPKVRGTLQDAAENPLAGEIYLWSDLEFVGPDGRFEIEAPEAMRADGIQYGYAVDATKSLGLVFIYDTTKPKEQYPLTLLPLMTVKGQALDASGKPVKLIEDDLVIFTGNTGRPANFFVTEIQEGAFSISRIPSGVPMKLEINHAGYRRTIDMADLKPGKVRDLGRIDVAAEAATQKRAISAMTGVIQGRLVDSEGRGVAGIRVYCRGATDRWNNSDQITDQAGRFTLKNLPANSKVDLYYISEDYGSSEILKVSTDTTDLVWKLKSIASDLIGKPAPKVEVGQWINGELPPFEKLRGKVVMLWIQGNLDRGTNNHFIHEFARVAKEYADKGLAAAMIINPFPKESSQNNWDLSADDAMDYVQEMQWTFPVGGDAFIPVAELKKQGALYGSYSYKTHWAYQNRSAPTVYLIDKRGIVRGVAPMSEIETKVRALLAEPHP